MSLTKIQEPNLITPVNDLIPIVYGSDNADQDGFRYKLSLNYDDGTDIVDIWIWPDPNKSNIGAYNAQQIYRDYISYDKSRWNSYLITGLTDTIIDYNYDITEYIGSTSGDTASGATDFYTFRGVTTYDTPFEYIDYILTGETLGGFLSKWSGDRTYKLTEYATLNVLNGLFGIYGSYFDRLRIIVDGTWYYIQNDQTQDTIVSLPIGPQNINDASTANDLYKWTSESIYPYGLITSGTTEYTIDLWYDTGAEWQQVSDQITIKLDSDCYKWDGTRFLWLGDLSTFETFTFNFANIKEFEHSRDETKKDLYTLDATNGYTYSTGDRERRTVNVSTIEKHTAISGWLSDDESSNLMELYRSPEVYVIKNGSLYPVIITTNEVEEKNITNNRLFNHTIEYEMSYDIKNNL